MLTCEPRTAQRMTQSILDHYGPLTKRWSYDYGVIWRGMEALHALTGDEQYFRLIQGAMDTFISEDGDIRDYSMEALNLDYICNGRQLLSLYKATGEAKYRKAADNLREQLRRQPRTPEGGFWHKQCYPWQMWLDGLHMSAPFYVEYCLMTGDEDGVMDACHQLKLAYERTLDPKTGLNRHAWDASREQPWADKSTGQAPHAWGRAMGWYMLGLADVLALLPRNHPCFGELQTIFRRTAEKLLRIRDGGVWLQVLDCPDRPGNYRESSASCLMVCAMLKMARLGIVPAEIGQAAQESFRAIQREFVGTMQDGRMFLGKCCQVGGLGGRIYRDGSFDYYMSEPIVAWDLKGTGAYIQAACEMEALL